MSDLDLKALLAEVAAGSLSVDQALQRLQPAATTDLGFARLDHDRASRCGFPEVILAEGKTVSQVAEIFLELARRHDRVLATRASKEQAAAVCQQVPEAEYEELSRTLRWIKKPLEQRGEVAILAAGTSDLPVALEARITAELLEARTVLHADIGVAGLHRLLAIKDDLTSARVVVVVAGMEGALPSVVAGLLTAPVIAVPTSVGYGASFGGLAALLGMLNSCAAGVSVVNIDNGFGAGYQAGLINHSADSLS
jgi:hypothetical protein